MVFIDRVARVFKLLSDPTRLKILFTLENESRSVSQIIEMTGLSQPLVSFHLKALREAGLIKTYRKSTFVFNALCDEELIVLIRQFEKYGVDGDKTPNFDMPFRCPPWKGR